jgi:hypothetical protein
MIVALTYITRCITTYELNYKDSSQIIHKSEDRNHASEFTT